MMNITTWFIHYCMPSLKKDQKKPWLTPSFNHTWYIISMLGLSGELTELRDLPVTSQ